MRRLAAHLRLQKHSGGATPPLDAPAVPTTTTTRDPSPARAQKRPAASPSPNLPATKKLKAAPVPRTTQSSSRAHTPVPLASPDEEFEFDLPNAHTPVRVSSAVASPAQSDISLPRATTGGKGLAIKTTTYAALSEDEGSDDTGSEYEDDTAGLLSAIDRQMSQPVSRPIASAPVRAPAPAPVSRGPFQGGSMPVASMLGGGRASPGLSDDESESSDEE